MLPHKRVYRLYKILYIHNLNGQQRVEAEEDSADKHRGRSTVLGRNKKLDGGGGGGGGEGGGEEKRKEKRKTEFSAVVTTSC